MPAFEQNRSIGAVAADGFRDQTRRSASRVTSVSTPNPPISAASRCAASPSMSATTTAFAPSAANLRHSARADPVRAAGDDYDFVGYYH